MLTHRGAKDEAQLKTQAIARIGGEYWRGGYGSTVCKSVVGKNSSDYLKEISSDRQVFITTHSTNFLDTGNFQNIFLVQKGASTKLSSLSLAEAEEKLPGELGIRLSSLFMYDQIIFVEGPSDEQIIREFAKTMGVNVRQSKAGCRCSDSRTG